jgi:hypothetical protein
MKYLVLHIIVLYINYNSLKILGCDLTTQQYHNIKYKFNVTPKGPNIHFTSDACHNVKLTVNALGKLQVLRDGNKLID